MCICQYTEKKNKRLQFTKTVIFTESFVIIVMAKAQPKQSQQETLCDEKQNDNRNNTNGNNDNSNITMAIITDMHVFMQWTFDVQHWVILVDLLAVQP